jgi:hypothetical protein
LLAGAVHEGIVVGFNVVSHGSIIFGEII